MRTSLFCLLGLCLTVNLVSPATAQFIDDKPAPGVETRLRNPQTTQFQVGAIIRAKGAPLRGVFATTPVPTEWEEQKVKVMREDKTPDVRGITYRTVGNTTKQMLITIPSVAPGASARALVTLEITRSEIVPPTETAQYRIPEKVEPAVRMYLGASPYIETRNLKIRDLAKKLFAEKEGATDWQKVEALYDGTRSRVRYVNGKLKGALAALNDGTGDCEELTSLFIALCRINGIPARTVWVPEHCYPEFYLVDKDGKGHWFPCQAAGDRCFGGIPEMRPILQKGDNFITPENSKPQRYVAEFLKIKDPGGQKPSFEFVRKAVTDTPAVPAAAATGGF